MRSMDSRSVLGLAIGLLSAGCADFQVVLGCNWSEPGACSSGDAASGSGDADAGSSDADAGNTAAPSCQEGGAGLTNCGSAAESCCTSLEVPGGTFYRTFTNTGSGPTLEADPATVSGFRLDKYLATVGRFRQFVTAWNGGWRPQAGAGKHAHLNGGKGLAATGGGYEPGWVTSDDSYVAPSDTNLQCIGDWVPDMSAGSNYYAWTSLPSDNENLPMNCVNWYEAYAFCIWDGGFLPSEAEWRYAAFGGAAQLEYPWGSTDPGTGSQYAIYGCYYPDASGTCTGVQNIAPVGSAPLGAGMWEHLDLGGGLWEWNLDWYAATYVNPCVDCADSTAATYRVMQGGNFDSVSFFLPPARRSDKPADTGAYAYGIRCARTP
jgi:formylglycine-generating enzyme required for sulfatase activity